MTGCQASPKLEAARRGGVLILTLACLAVSAALVAAMLRGSLTARRALRAERDLRQVEQLLDAASTWAVARIRAGTTSGDTLTLESSEIAGLGPARIDLAVARKGAGWRARIGVEYPLDAQVPIRRGRDFVVPADRSEPPEETSP